MMQEISHARGVSLDEPAPRSPWWTHLLVLAAVLAAALPPLLINLGVGDSKHTMENIALLSAQDTWLRQHGHHDIAKHTDAWLMPTRNGQPRVTKPPLLVWADLLAWIDLSPDQATASIDVLTYRARLVSVATALVLLLSIYWLGASLGDVRLAAMASLVIAGDWFFQRQARVAAYDIQMAAWASLSVAGAVWAIRAEGPSGARRWIGWIVAALALALGWMTKGPLAAVIVALPLSLMILLQGRRVIANLLCLAGVLTVAALLVAPWYAYAYGAFEEARRVWATEFKAHRPEFQTPVYYLAIFALLLPWTPWLIAGLVHPFSEATGAGRRQRLMAWAWFVSILVFFSIPGAKQQRYILPILPAAALLIGQVFRDHAELARLGIVHRGARLLWLPHWIALLAISVVFGPMMIVQAWLHDTGRVAAQFVGPIGWYAGPSAPTWNHPVGWAIMLGGGGVLTALAILGWRLHARWRPLGAGLASAAWAIVFTSIFLFSYTQAAHRYHPLRPEAERIAALVGDAPLRRLNMPGQDLINEEFLLYARRIVPDATPSQLQRELDALPPGAGAGAGAGGVLYVMAAAEGDADAALRELGFEPVTDFLEDLDIEAGPGTDHDRPHRLWRREKPPGNPA